MDMQLTSLWNWMWNDYYAHIYTKKDPYETKNFGEKKIYAVKK